MHILMCLNYRPENDHLGPFFLIKEHSLDFSPLNKAQCFTININENKISFQKKPPKLALGVALLGVGSWEASVSFTGTNSKMEL